MRTTLDIDKPILDELKALKRSQGKSLGKLVSELLSRSLRDLEGSRSGPNQRFTWNSEPMGSRVDLEDKASLYAALEKDA